MKNKIFLQVSPILYAVLIFLCAIIFGCTYVIIIFLISELQSAGLWEWLQMISVLLLDIFMCYSFIRMAKNRIILKEREIFVPGNWGGREVKLQYETRIDYGDIESIYMIMSFNNSLNKPLRWGTLPMPYIIFNCKEDVQKAINVVYYSKKQVIIMIDEIILRAKKIGNVFEMKTGKAIISDFVEKSKKRKKRKS